MIKSKNIIEKSQKSISVYSRYILEKFVKIILILNFRIFWAERALIKNPIPSCKLDANSTPSCKFSDI